MYAVNTLVNDAYEAVGMTNIGDDTEGTMAKIGERELNRAITTLNAQGFLAMSQKWADAEPATTVKFHVLEPGEAAEGSIDMPPPVKVEAVGRKLGNRFIQLRPTNHMQIAARNPGMMATAYTYDTDIEDTPGGSKRTVGILTLDGNPHGAVRIWYNGQIPHYTLSDTIYLSDLYNELLLSALCVNLAEFYELSPEKKAKAATDLTTAKNLIKNPTAQQRMGQCGPIGTSWADNYVNGLNGAGF